MYLQYLRIIDKKSEQIEEKLHFIHQESGADGAAGTGEVTGLLYNLSAVQ